MSQPGHLVYSPHDYRNTVYAQSFFRAADFPDNMTAIFERRWGHAQREGIAPLWLGEFGSQLNDPLDQGWFSALSNYPTTGGATGASWSWWSIDPSSVDVGGSLQADWQTPSPLVLATLQPLLRAGPPAASEPLSL